MNEIEIVTKYIEQVRDFRNNPSAIKAAEHIKCLHKIQNLSAKQLLEIDKFWIINKTWSGLMPFCEVEDDSRTIVKELLEFLGKM